MDTVTDKKFSCAVFPSLPADLDEGFCAKRHRKSVCPDLAAALVRATVGDRVEVAA